MTLSDYKKAYPYICNSCGEFSYNLAEYCNYCGTKGSMRKAKNIDYKEKGIDKKTSSISKAEAKKSLKNSIITIVIAIFISSIGFFYPFHTTVRVYVFLFSLIFMLVGIISLIIYFINPEISYGMWMNRNKSKNIRSRNVLNGRRVLDIIWITGLCITIFVFIKISL